MEHQGRGEQGNLRHAEVVKAMSFFIFHKDISLKFK